MSDAAGPSARAERLDARTGNAFSIRKTWMDTGPGVELVQINYAWTPLGQEPNWDASDSVVLIPSADAPGLRSAVIEVPRFVEGQANYALHHFFFVVAGTERVTSPVITEEIVSRGVDYEDAVGECTHVGIAWGVSAGSPQLATPNYTTCTMDGLRFHENGADLAAEPAAIHEFVRAQPLPHLFRGAVWGPRGFEVRYVFHLVHSGSPRPEQDWESWYDNNGDGWSLRL